MRLTLRASAKINLDLRVFDRRPDGYHEVRTVLQTLALHDTIIVERARGPFRLNGDASLMPLDRTNLVWRAAEAVWRAAGREGDPAGARVRVVKRIPSQAGLGGGSSDAAAALVGLSRLWRLPGTLAHLMPIAASLGADVPFFLIGGAALGLGRGEHVYPLVGQAPHHVVLVRPDFGVATADAYRWLTEDRADDRMLHPAPGTLDAAPWTLNTATLRNDLEAPVEARHPLIKAIRLRLASQGAEAARMSGSGSAVFGLFPNDRMALRATAAMRAEGHQVVLTRTRARNSVEGRRLA